MNKFLKVCCFILAIIVCLVVWDGISKSDSVSDEVVTVVDEIMTHGLVVVIVGAIGLSIANKKKSQKTRAIVINGCALYLIFQWFGLFGLASAGIALLAKYLIDKRPYDKEKEESTTTSQYAVDKSKTDSAYVSRSLSSPDDIASVGKYTNLGIDENIAYNSCAAEAAADSYIASKSNNNQRKHKSDHTALLTFAIIVAFVCILVFGGIYADGGFDALLADTEETDVSPQHMTYSEWRAMKRAEEEAAATAKETMSFDEWTRKYLEEKNSTVPAGPTPVSEPTSGTILSGYRVTDGSELTISTSNHSCVVKLKDSAGVTKMSFYVRKNTKITMTVPSEYMYVYFASGETWYGYNHLFGEDTSYSKDDDLLDFNNYTFEYTLYPVTNGNFTETIISENEFKD